jgi:hypothetical protein
VDTTGSGRTVSTVEDFMPDRRNPPGGRAAATLGLALAIALAFAACADQDEVGPAEPVGTPPAGETPIAHDPGVSPGEGVEVESPDAVALPGTGAADGRYRSGRAGVVILESGNGELLLEGVEPAVGWSPAIREADEAIEIVFTSPDGEQAVEFLARLEDDDTLDIEVIDRRVLEDAPVTFEMPEGAGVVTFTVSDGRVRLDDVEPAPEWDVREQEGDNGVKVELLASAHFVRTTMEVEVSDDDLEIRTITRYGPGYLDDRDG